MSVIQKNKINKSNNKRTFRSVKHKNRTQRKRKTLKLNKRKTSGGTDGSSKKVYKSSKQDVKSNRKLEKLRILSQKLPDIPVKSLDRATVKIDNNKLSGMSSNEIEEIYRQWRNKEAADRKVIRTAATQKNTPWPPKVHYQNNNAQFDPYNTNNEFQQSFSETANWLDEMPPAMQPSRRITPSSVKKQSSIKKPNQQFNAHSQPKELRADFDEKNYNEDNNVMEFDEDNIELLDIDYEN